MNAIRRTAIVACLMLSVIACTHKQSTTDTSTSTTSESQTPQPPVASADESSAQAPSALLQGRSSRPSRDFSASAITPVTFDFSSIKLSTDNPPILRLMFTIHNGTGDPLQCDASEFSVMPSNGSVVDVDTSAENSCEPDTIDPHSTGKATMVFDLKSAYAGPLSVIMTVDDKVLGRGNITIH